jgi:cell division protein FtsI (penicillin-binding protein 3)
MKKKKVFPKEGGHRRRKQRIALLSLFFLAGFSVVTYRCLYLHLARDPKLAKLARSQYKTRLEEPPPRGNIYDASGEELAVSVPTYSAAARPGRIREREKVLSELLPILGMKPDEIKLNPEKKYVWLKRHLTPREKQELEGRKLAGIELVKGSKRFYPNREVGSQILGAVGNENQGLGGLELFYDRYLRGEEEEAIAYRDARGKTFETEETIGREKRGPHHLTLTLRKNIQYVTERELNAACDAYRAKSCTAIALDPRTGQVLAMASYPNFNPNAYQVSNLEHWRNRAVTDAIEPGSTFKVILAAAALESGLVKVQDRFHCENGALRIGDRVIHDHEKHGMLSFREIMKVSSNIGIYKIGQKVGKKEFAEAIERFGFGKKSGIDYPGEVAGFVRPVKSWQEVEFANIAFGQGVQVTPLQLAAAFAATANGGLRMRPYLVSRVTDPEGETLLEVKPKAGERVLSEKTARLLLDILQEVTHEGGTGTKAALPGYTVAGKTGTAQKVVDGTYSHMKFISSFVGIVPARSPRLVVLVTIDEPQGVVYGGLVAAPVFRKIAWAALRDLGVPPDKEDSLERSEKPLIQEAKLTGR